MAKKKTEIKAQQPAVIIRNGKWVTADGLCFNTFSKAWNHIREIEKNKHAVGETAKSDDSQAAAK